MARTKVGRSSFYIHFASLYEVIGALLDQVTEELAGAGTLSVFTRTEGPRSDLRGAIRGAIEIWTKRGPMLRAIAQAAPHDPELEEKWLVFSRSTSSFVVDQVRRAQQDGRLPHGNPDEIAFAVNLLVVNYLNERLGGPDRVDGEVVRETLEFFLFGTGFGSI